VKVWACQSRIWRCRRNISSLAISISSSGTLKISPVMVTLEHRGSCKGMSWHQNKASNKKNTAVVSSVDANSIVQLSLLICQCDGPNGA